MAKRIGRLRHQLPHCYYEGYLEKRSFRDKTSRKLWTCLCGNTLFFFNDKRDSDYIEKVDLREFVSLTDDNSLDKNLDAARMTLQLKKENIKFTAPNGEARELWKGFILSITELSVPSSLNLLPGQIHILKEAVDKEKQRLDNATPVSAAGIDTNPYVKPVADMPACYQTLNRLEAEFLLERECLKGNLLLRPSGNGSFAVTTRQELEDPEFKHYRVSRKPEGGFLIDVEEPIHCETLHDVINFFIHKTDGVLKPLLLEETYERSISFVQSDNENGERSIQRPTSSPIPPNVPPKPVKVPTPEPEAMIEECIYLNDIPIEEEEKAEDVSTAPPAQVTEAAKPPKKAILPPVPTPRRIASSPALTLQPTATLTGQTAPPTASRVRCNTNPMGDTISELKSILERKSKYLD